MFTTTINALAAKLGVEYATAMALAKLAVASGKGKEVGKQPTATGKGKPATIYELPEVLNIELVPVEVMLDAA